MRSGCEKKGDMNWNFNAQALTENNFGEDDAIGPGQIMALRLLVDMMSKASDTAIIDWKSSTQNKRSA